MLQLHTPMEEEEEEEERNIIVGEIYNAVYCD